MTKAKGGLSGVDTGAEQFKLEGRFQFAPLGRRRSLHAKPRLTDAHIELSIRSKLAFERRQLRRSYGVEPIGVIRFERIAGIEHCEAVDLQRSFTVLARLRSWRRI